MSVPDKRILSVGYNQPLLSGRNTRLEKAGYSVVGATSLDEARQVFSHDHFQLVIVGSAIPAQELSAFIHDLKRIREVPVLLLCLGNRSEVPADAYLNIVNGLHRLVTAVDNILAKPSGIALPADS